MKYIVTIRVPSTTKDVVSSVVCDLCGKPIIKANNSAEEVEVYHKTGDNYPDGGRGEIAQVDMCGQCFDTRLVPWLKEQGARIETRNWDW